MATKCESERKKQQQTNNGISRRIRRKWRRRTSSELNGIWWNEVRQTHTHLLSTQHKNKLIFIWHLECQRIACVCVRRKQTPFISQIGTKDCLPTKKNEIWMGQKMGIWAMNGLPRVCPPSHHPHSDEYVTALLQHPKSKPFHTIVPPKHETICSENDHFSRVCVELFALLLAYFWNKWFHLIRSQSPHQCRLKVLRLLSTCSVLLVDFQYILNVWCEYSTQDNGIQLDLMCFC